jgi:IMP dehydrogenase
VLVISTDSLAHPAAGAIEETTAVQILPEISRTFGEYLLLPNLTDENCTPDDVDLSAPLVRHRVGGPAALSLAVPLLSAIMEAVSSPRLAISLAQCGGLAFIHQNRRSTSRPKWCAASSGTRPAFGTVTSTSNRRPRSAR